MRAVFGGVHGNIPGCALGEIGHLPEGEQDMEKSRVNFIGSEDLAHQRFGDFQLRSSLLGVQRAGDGVRRQSC